MVRGGNDFVARMPVWADHYRMRHRGESITPDPFAVTRYEKASRAFYVLLSGGLIDHPKREPRHLRQVMMNQMIVIVQEQLTIIQSLTRRASTALF
jgi:hypothetical protein